MIQWFDMPAEGLSNGGLFEVKELEVTENGTYEEKGEMYNKVVVNVPLPTGKITITENGTNIDVTQYAKADVNVEGGGGSSDFSTAEVTFLFAGLPEGVTPFLYEPFLNINIGTDDNPNIWGTPEFNYRSYDDGIFKIILYKGTAVMFEGVANVTGSDNNIYVRDYDNPVTLSGAIEEGGDFIITGDCSITVPLVAE